MVLHCVLCFCITVNAFLPSVLYLTLPYICLPPGSSSSMYSLEYKW